MKRIELNKVRELYCELAWRYRFGSMPQPHVFIQLIISLCQELKNDFKIKEPHEEKTNNLHQQKRQNNHSV